MDSNNYEIYEAKYKPVYGENWEIMISRKIQKEIDVKNGNDSEKSPLGEFFEAYNDIEGDVFAAKRKNLGNGGKMPSENLTQGEKMEIYDLKVSTAKNDNATNTFHRREELTQTLKPFASKPLVNKHDGRVAYISVKNLGKFGSDAAIKTSIDNGFTEAQHFAAAKHLPELYENAFKRGEPQPDLKNGDPNVQIPRYEIAFNLDGEIAVAKITLKETLKGKYKGNKLYTIELESIVKLPNGL